MKLEPAQERVARVVPDRGVLSERAGRFEMPEAMASDEIGKVAGKGRLGD